MRKSNPALVIVGGGLFGLTIARLCAETLNKRVLLYESRDHIGGNAYSYVDRKTNVDVHKYGSHIFHTSNQKVWNFVNQFSDWIPYHHKVFSLSQGETFSLPVNLATIEKFAGKKLNSEEAVEWIRMKTEGFKHQPENFEELALSSVGREIYERLFKGYTTKQWGASPSLIQSNVFKRLPIRFDYNNDYFSDDFQAVPSLGYGKFLETLADHEGIEIVIGKKYVYDNFSIDTPLIYTGAIDEFFNYKYGILPWRTLDFEFQEIDINQFQDHPVVNYPDLEVPWTRIHEFKHFPSQRRLKEGSTLIAKEFSRSAERGDEPYYPIEGEMSRETLLLYRGESKKLANVLFAGRLGSFKYLDMHMAIASAMSHFDNWIIPRLK